MPHAQDIEMFLVVAKRGESTRKLHGIIERAPKQEVMAWRDKDDLDVMHHVILANNVEAVEYLLQHGLFVRPHLPAVTPYCHLAALLGEKAILQVLLQYRPDDYAPLNVPVVISEPMMEAVKNSKRTKKDTLLKSVTLPSSISTSSFSSNSTPSQRSSKGVRKYTIESLSTLQENLKLFPNIPISPLQMAARTGQIECVKVILNQCVLKKHHGDSTGSSDLALACVADSDQSVALILSLQSPSQTEWESAVEVCLHHAHPECLELLLSLGKETKHMFKGINFLHVLFSSSSAQERRSYPRLEQTTEVLLRHGHDPGCRLPCRTYPMYTLLTHAFCFHEYDNTQYYVKALRLLLKHGADPNFDEVHYEKRNPRQAAKKVSGRSAFSSALHCLLETVESYSQYLESPALAVSFVEDCAGVLVKFKASMNHVGHIGDHTKVQLQGSVLHQMAKSSVTVGVNPAIVRCILRHGADPNLKVNGKYAINVYFDRLFDLMRSLKVKDAKKGYMEDCTTMMRLCMFMTSASIKDCLNIFLKDHKTERSAQMQPYLTAVKEELTRRSRQVHPLRDVSAWAVWKACGYQFERVHKLQVSSEIKTYVLPMAF